MTHGAESEIVVDRNQHYVPQSYMRRFAIPGTGGKKIVRYSIKFDKIEANKSIKSIASATNFYDSELDPFLEQTFGKKSLEDILSSLETEYSALLKRIEGSLKASVAVSKENQQSLAYHLYLQYVRTESYRKGVDWPVSPLSNAAGQAILMMQEEAYSEAVKLFGRRRFILANPAKGFNFPTSDNPLSFLMAFYADESDITGSFSRFFDLMGRRVHGGTRGVDLVLPLNRDFVLLGLDEDTSSVKPHAKQTMMTLDVNATVQIIGGIAMSADQYILGADTPDIEYAVGLLKWKRQQLQSRSDAAKEEVKKVMEARRKTYPKDHNVFSDYLEARKGNAVCD